MTGVKTQTSGRHSFVHQLHRDLTIFQLDLRLSDKQLKHTHLVSRLAVQDVETRN